jgi:hypothetical protein
MAVHGDESPLPMVTRNVLDAAHNGPAIGSRALGPRQTTAFEGAARTLLIVGGTSQLDHHYPTFLRGCITGAP